MEIEIARAMFPLMPAEVFEAWLAPLIAAQGWPFTNVDDSILVDDWSRILIERPLTEWASFEWAYESHDEVNECLSSGSLGDVMQLMMHGTPMGSGAALVVRDSKDRYMRARDIMMEIKGFPGFVTAYEDAGGKLWVVDGHHRIAALSSFPGYKAVAVPFWVAKDGAG